MASTSRILGRLGFTRSQRTNLNHHNTLLQQGKLCVSLAGYRRLHSIKDTSKKRRMSSFEEMLRDCVGDRLDEVPSDEEGLQDYSRETVERFEDGASETAFWGITTERDRGLKPTVEPIFSIRRKTLALETLIAPELEKPHIVLGDPFGIKPILKFQYFPDYVKRKWSLILQKEDNLRVKQLMELMEVAGIPQVIFIQALAEFSFVPLKYIYIICHPLSHFTPEQVEYCLRSHFSVEHVHHPNLELEIKSITDVLMKIE